MAKFDFSAPGKKKHIDELNFTSFDAIRLTIASPVQIKAWSYGEVKKPGTKCFRSFKTSETVNSLSKQAETSIDSKPIGHEFVYNIRDFLTMSSDSIE